MMTPSERRDTVQVLVRRGISQRKALRYLGLSRRIASYAPRQAAKDQAVAEWLLAASPKVPRFGYRRMAAWLDLGEARVRRLWRQLGLNIPRRRPRRRRSGNDIRLPGAVRPNAVWSYDFVHDQMVDGRALKMLCVIDEYTRECLAIEVGASLRAQDVILTLSRLMRIYGKPAFVRSDNGAEFTAAKVMRWLRDAAIGPAWSRVSRSINGPISSDWIWARGSACFFKPAAHSSTPMPTACCRRPPTFSSGVI